MCSMTNDGTQRETFWRIGENEVWVARREIQRPLYGMAFSPFTEISISKAPYVIINKPWRSLVVMLDMSPVPGRHMIISDEVLGLTQAWQAQPKFGGFERLSELLDSCYD